VGMVLALGGIRVGGGFHKNSGCRVLVSSIITRQSGVKPEKTNSGQDC